MRKIITVTLALIVLFQAFVPLALAAQPAYPPMLPFGSTEEPMALVPLKELEEIEEMLGVCGECFKWAPKAVEELKWRREAPLEYEAKQKGEILDLKWTYCDREWAAQISIKPKTKWSTPFLVGVLLGLVIPGFVGR